MINAIVGYSEVCVLTYRLTNRNDGSVVIRKTYHERGADIFHLIPHTLDELQLLIHTHSLIEKVGGFMIIGDLICLK